MLLINNSDAFMAKGGSDYMSFFHLKKKDVYGRWSHPASALDFPLSQHTDGISLFFLSIFHPGPDQPLHALSESLFFYCPLNETDMLQNQNLLNRINLFWN